MPKRVEEVRFRIERVREMSLGVLAPFEAKRLPFEGLRLGRLEASSDGGVAVVRLMSNGRRGTGR